MPNHIPIKFLGQEIFVLDENGIRPSGTKPLPGKPNQPAIKIGRPTKPVVPKLPQTGDLKLKYAEIYIKLQLVGLALLLAFIWATMQAF